MKRRATEKNNEIQIHQVNILGMFLPNLELALSIGQNSEDEVDRN